jgi:hypothetical protein
MWIITAVDNVKNSINLFLRFNQSVFDIGNLSLEKIFALGGSY